MAYMPTPMLKTLQLKPVLSAKAKVIQINRIRVDESVSYEGIFRPDHENYITTLPLGFVVGMVSRRIVDKIM